MKPASDYRKQAWSALSGKWGMAILVYILYGLIVGVAGCTVVGAILLAGPMAVGYACVWLNLHRLGRVDINDLFSGFNNFGDSLVMGLLSSIFVALWSLLFIIPGIVASYSYAMAPYILVDNPNIGGYEAIGASKAMMKGKRWKLFCLDLSYIGWLILCMLTFGILTLWVSPSISAARAAFYEDLKSEKAETATDENNETAQ